MATVQSDRVATGLPGRLPHSGVFCEVGTFEASSTSANDVIEMVPAAAGATALDVFVVHDALGASVTLDIGHGDDDDYWAAAAMGTDNTAGVIRADAGTAFPLTFSSNDTIDVTIQGAAATGTITLVALFTAENVDLG